MTGMAWTYILECADGFYYVGSARDLDQRAWEHEIGSGSRFTAKRLPVKLVWAQEFDNIGEAYAMERRLHGWSRAKKAALIAGRFDEVSRLARRGTGRSHETDRKRE
ncbi:hypothetical protein BCR15_10905 [Tessaracoccus lapidicaptus]|uniref:GIY-YIG domain-containing protein n=2 Tax=Tessaracoccus lapidicaptus TaxID=1427523 RepID=A0A1C0ASE4_9ACTN|nr:hypothetical protein BCR15_10905 [Tessaracoccus lapidicaptus]